MESDSEDEDEDDTPVQFRCQSVQHPGGVNHIAMCPHESSLAATWADTGQVHMWDLAPQVAALDKPGKSTNIPGRAAYTFGGHAEEGYAMAWSPVVPYRFATGDNAANIHVWNRRDDGSFVRPSFREIVSLRLCHCDCVTALRVFLRVPPEQASLLGAR